MELSKEELNQFRENGFLLLKNFAEPLRCAAIREIAEVHLKYKIPPIETESEYIGSNHPVLRESVRRLRQVYDRDIIFKKWMEEPEIRPVLREILGEKPVLLKAHHNSIMTKLPGSSTSTEWHQDKRYWHYNGDNMVSVWLALGEENSQNGVLEFIPGSHKMDFPAEAFDKKQFFRDDYEPNKDLISGKVSYPLETGDVILFHCRLLHRANENKSKKSKISFVYTVKGESVTALANTRSSAYKEIILS